MMKDSCAEEIPFQKRWPHLRNRPLFLHCKVCVSAVARKLWIGEKKDYIKFSHSILIFLWA